MLVKYCDYCIREVPITDYSTNRRMCRYCWSWRLGEKANMRLEEPPESKPVSTREFIWFGLAVCGWMLAWLLLG